MSIHQVYSRLTAPTDAVRDALENDVQLPDTIADIEVKHVNGKLQLQSVPESDDIGRYTPTAAIKASLSESTVVVEDDGTVTHESVTKYKQNSGWQAMNEEEEYETTTVEYADFYGTGDEVIVHDALREDMFEVLCQLTAAGTTGYVQGVVLEDGELVPIWYDAGGDEIEAELNITRAADGNGQQEENTGSTNQTGTDWRAR